MMKARLLLAAALWLAASYVLAEVQIVDRPVNGEATPVSPAEQAPQSAQDSAVLTAPTPVVTTTTTDVTTESSSPTPVANSNSASEMFYQMQVMQQEILELRGALEEQAHQFKQLKQQRLDDYVDLDRRLGALNPVGGSANTSSNPSAGQAGSGQVSSGTTGTALPVNDEKAHYQSAIDPIIGKVKNLDLAISLLHEHLKRFPNGQFAGNAKYWLGESYLVKDNTAESRKWFESLLNEYPLHGKVPAAKYKLGVVYHKLGMNAQARTMLEEVRDAGGPAASRATEYIDANL